VGRPKKFFIIKKFLDKNERGFILKVKKEIKKGGRMKPVRLWAAWLLLMLGISQAQWQVVLTTNLDGVEDQLVFGTDPRGSDSLDIGLDMPGPPPPPSGSVLQFRFNHPWISGLTTDIRNSASTEIRWDIVFLGSPLPRSASLSWDPLSLPESGEFRIGSAAEGSPVSEWNNMRSTSSFNIPIGYNYVQIYYSSGVVPPEDTIPPYTRYWSPADGDTGVAVDANISVDILDDGSGVDSSSIRLNVGGYPVPRSYYEITAIPGGYHLFFDPPVTFPPATEVVVILQARDYAHNSMADTVTFRTTGAVSGHRVYGQVTLEGTTNYSGSIVVIVGAGFDTTDIDGMYDISGVSSGIHTIYVSHTGYNPDSATINVVSDTMVNFHLTRAITTINVYGTITLEGATDHSGTEVLIVHSGGIDTTTTDELGRYLFTGITPGPISLSASHTGYVPRDTTFTATTNVEVNMTLSRVPVEVWRVYGYITLEGATDFSGTTVRLYNETFDSTTTTDRDGFYQFTSVPTGTYTITISHAGYQTYTEEIDVVRNTEVSVELLRAVSELPAPSWLEASEGLTYKIIVRWGPPHLTPPPGSEVELLTDDGEVDTVESAGGEFTHIYLGSPGGYIANKFVSPGPGSVLIGFKANLSFPVSGSYFFIRAWDNTGEDGAPGDEFLLPVWISRGDSGTYWYETPLPNVPIPSSEFYLGWEETDMPPTVGIDTDDLDSASWVYLSEYGWNPLSAFSEPFNTFDLMIRAIVVTPSGKTMELAPVSTSPSADPWRPYSVSSSIAITSIAPYSLKPATRFTREPLGHIASFRRPLSTLRGYNIYRSLSPFETTTDAELIASLMVDTLTMLEYVDSGEVIPGVTYYYRATAVYVEGESDLSPMDSGSCIGIAPPATVLVLDWDDGDLLADGGSAEESNVIVNLLNSIGVTDVLVSNQNEHLDRFDLTPSNYRAVIIITGAYPQAGYMSDDDFNKLTAYLEAGGRIYMEGVDMGWICNDDAAVGSEASLAFWELFRVNWDSDGEPASTGNVQTLTTNASWPDFGRRFEITYDYKTAADHYVDELSSNGATMIMVSQDGIGRMSAFRAPGTTGYRAVESAVYIGAMNTGLAPEANLRARILGSILNFFGIPNTAVDEKVSLLPNSLELRQNYPNPFNSSTSFTFALPTAGDIELSVYNVTGEKIQTVARGKYVAGVHTVNWTTPQNLPSGIYFYSLKFNDETITKKLLYMK